MKISLYMMNVWRDYEAVLDGDSVTVGPFISRMGPQFMVGSHRDPSEPKREVLLPVRNVRFAPAVPSDDLRYLHIDGQSFTVNNPKYLEAQITDDWRDRHLVKA